MLQLAMIGALFLKKGLLKISRCHGSVVNLHDKTKQQFLENKTKKKKETAKDEYKRV